LFKKKKELEMSGDKVDITMNCMEIYNEEVYDLLSNRENEKSSKKREALEIKINEKNETIVKDLSSRAVGSEEEVYRLLEVATEKRSTGATAMNAGSSRSHAITTFELKIVKNNANSIHSDSMDLINTSDENDAGSSCSSNISMDNHDDGSSSSIRGGNGM
jgi:hypothetical protein